MNHSNWLFARVQEKIGMKTIFIPTEDDEEFAEDEWGIEESEW
ncbi:MAG: hypothetical protein R3327_03810 [Nitrosopumilaceae archaeon]|nr:hypothetical protein [Nitrosopumilaceae archaeon]